MTKPPKPNWCDAAISTEIPPIELSNEQAIALAKLFGHDDPDTVDHIKTEIEEIAYQYCEYQSVIADGPTYQDRNKEIDGILKTVIKLQRQLQEISYDSRADIAEGLMNEVNETKSLALDDGYQRLDELERHLAHFSPAISSRLTELKRKRRGPSTRRSVALVLKNIVDLYETYSNKRFTHTSHVNGEHVPTPQSAGGEFVLAVMDAIDPSVPNQTISGELRKYIAERRPSKA